MLTRDLLNHRTSKGIVRPVYVKKSDEEVYALAEDLTGIVTQAVGEERKDLGEALDARSKGFKRQKVAKGLVKLLFDRMAFEEPGEDAGALRRDVFARSRTVMSALEDGASIADFEANMEAALASTLGETREALYTDLLEHRRLLEWKKLDGKGLVERYNLALAQGLVMFAQRLSLSFESGDATVVRRVLRWLKFCRLVADVERHEDSFVLHVEGPAAMLSSSKKYGLQLAVFLEIVPVLEQFTLEAIVTPPRRSEVTFMLTEEEQLVSPLRDKVGHVPEEITTTLAKLDDLGPWKIELDPVPRRVGAKGWSVPDLRFVHSEDGTELAVELFHSWHKSALLRRLDELESRPDPTLFLGVDRSVAKKSDIAARIDGHPSVFLFNKFPSARALSSILGAHGDDSSG